MVFKPTQANTKLPVAVEKPATGTGGGQTALTRFICDPSFRAEHEKRLAEHEKRKAAWALKRLSDLEKDCATPELRELRNEYFKKRGQIPDNQRLGDAVYFIDEIPRLVKSLRRRLVRGDTHVDRDLSKIEHFYGILNKLLSKERNSGLKVARGGRHTSLAVLERKGKCKQLVKQLLAQGMKSADAVKKAAREFNVTHRSVYRYLKNI